MTTVRAQTILGLALALSVAAACGAGPSPLPAEAAGLDEAVAAILARHDHAGRPFAVVDKQAARMVVHAADGRLLGQTSVLLGSAAGDRTVPGVGERTQQRRLRADDRTTPAGRFESRPGRNDTGDTVVWVDYDAAFAIHRVRPGAMAADRYRRLATPGADDKRVTAGCVVVPEAFFRAVVLPVLGSRPAVVYVLPEQPGWSMALLENPK